MTVHLLLNRHGHVEAIFADVTEANEQRDRLNESLYTRHALDNGAPFRVETRAVIQAREIAA